MEYAAFLDSKRRTFQGIGRSDANVPAKLYPFQSAITKWAIRKGRAAIWADCGLGKSFMQIAWMQALNVPTLILAPLCVAEQTVGEAAKLGVDLRYCKTPDESEGHPFQITNYERLDAFEAGDYSAVILDESSILKAFDGKTRTKLIQTFARTPYRLCCTATPSPNDIAELANHAEFLGLMTRAEFLATWFVHDDAGWRMKRHAVQPFYRWLASWAVAVRKPSDIGYDDAGFELPPLTISDVIVESDGPSTTLFPELGLKGIGGRLRARQDSLEARVDAVCNLVPEHGASTLIWCGLNTEAAALTAAIPGAVNIEGSDSYAVKRDAVLGFCAGTIKTLVSKIRILGFGLNFQHCHRMIFCGVGDSYEQYYQGIRRCWRFGQNYPVDVSIVVSDAERAVVENVRRKEAIADALSRDLLSHMADLELEELCEAVSAS